MKELNAYLLRYYFFLKKDPQTARYCAGKIKEACIKSGVMILLYDKLPDDEKVCPTCGKA